MFEERFWIIHQKMKASEEKGRTRHHGEQSGTGLHCPGRNQ
ncbi:hypothetical protein AALA80_17920 [Oscillospiraceae bacterium 50-60]